MKRRNLLFISAAVMMLLSGCGKTKESVQPENSQSAQNTQVAETAKASEKISDSETPVKEESKKTEKVDLSHIDVDLTELSGTMVYSEVYNMMVEPENYIGKVIKMNGYCSFYHSEEMGKTYFSCVIQDATACCSQGMEFVLNDTYQFPADYPKDGEDITVTGVFETYKEGEYLYCHLRDSVLA